MAASSQLYYLFESEADVLNLQVAQRVINVDNCLADFMRLKRVLLESGTHTRDSLAATAPSGDVILVCSSKIRFKIVAHLSENKNLFVRH